MDILKEIDERRKRESNIIIIGLPERGDVNNLDLAKILICDTLNCPADKLSLRRIGKPSHGKPKLFHLTLRDLKKVQAVLYSASGLKGNNQYKNFFLSPDRTPMEQEEFSELCTVNLLLSVAYRLSRRSNLIEHSPSLLRVPLLLAMDLNCLIRTMLLITNRTLHPIHGIQILLLLRNTYRLIIEIVVVYVTKYRVYSMLYIEINLTFYVSLRHG